MSDSSHVFDWCGLAALSDLETCDWRGVFSSLEVLQAEFLSHEDEFRSPQYKWPRDPLHNWSRVWEYPYVYHHLSRWLTAAGGKPLRVVDVGSGVTFIPFSLARLGCHVTCTDIDPVCARDIPLAASKVSYEPGRVDFRLIDGAVLPFADGEADVIYCISVLEHIPDFVNTISEIHRVLKPGGRLILTIDLDLRGDQQIGVLEHSRLMAALGQLFSPIFPDRFVHPADILSSGKGPFPVRGPRGLRRIKFMLKERLLKALLLQHFRPRIPFQLAIQGMVLLKRQGITH